MTFDELAAAASITNPYGSVDDYKRYLSNQGGDAGSPFNQQDYDAANQYALQGYDGAWNYNPNRGNGGEFQQVQPGSVAGQYADIRNLTRDYNGGSGVYDDTVRVDNSPSGFDNFLDWAMPAAVAIITGGAGAAAIGGAMGAGAAAGAGEGAAAGTAAGTAAEAAPAFTYGSAAPAWSQAAGTELGTGFYGTDAASMAGTMGTTAGGATGEIGSALGSGIAADGGAWAGAGGGWPGLMAEAGGGMASGSTDWLKAAQSLAKGLSSSGIGKGTQAVGAAPASLGSLGGGGGGSSAPGFSSSVQMPAQQQQASTPLTMLQNTPLTGFAAKDTSQDELNNSANIMRLAQALRGKTA